MRRVLLNDFSGGIAGDGSYVSGRQVADAHGFILDDQNRLRAQPAIDRHGGIASTAPFNVNPTDIFGLAAFRVGERVYLLFNTGYQLKYLKLARTGAASVPDQPGNYTATGEFLLPSNDTYPITPRGQIQWNRNNKLVPAYLYQYAPGTTQGGTPNAFVVLEKEDGTGLEVVTFQNFFPTIQETTENGATVTKAESSAIPRTQTATMWRGVPIFGGIDWTLDTSIDWKVGLNQTTAKAFPNYLFFGHPLNNGFVDPRYPLQVSETGTAIVKMFEVDEGLLCFTTGNQGQSGVVLVRGTPADYNTSDPNGVVERLSGFNPTGAACYWEEQQSVLFVTDDRRVVQYRGGRFADISPYSADITVAQQFDTVPVSTVTAVGRYVVYADAATNTVWVLRSYGEDGAWTRLVMPEGKIEYHSFIEAGGNVYFTIRDADQRAKLYSIHFAPTVPSGIGTNTFVAPGSPAVQAGPGSRRGLVAGVEVELRVVTSPQGANDPVTEKWWHEVGARVRRGSPTPATLVAIEQFVQTPTQEADSYRVEINAPVSAYERTEVVPGIGPAPILQIGLVCKGDAVIESIHYDFDSGTGRR